MAYFLKKTKTNNDIYLQIYDGVYDPERKASRHYAVQPLGYVKKLQAQGIEDPIAHYTEVVKRMNAERKALKQEGEKQEEKKLISKESPEKLLGYFLFKNVNDGLGVKPWLDLMQSVTNYRFNVYEMLAVLIYARMVMPCSKSKTFEEVIPRLCEKASFSLDQLYSGLEYMGQEYEKIIEIYNHQIAEKYGFDTSHTYFDCTNFYFEIDKEDDFRRKGPSKENRRDPIVGLGLMLDANQIPIGMKLYPGNESEKPVMRAVVDDLKRRHNIKGRTIHVADKGLNCAKNIFHAKQAGDGYIFSKSIKQLPKQEKEWVLNPADYKSVTDDSGKELYRIKECIDQFPYVYEDESGKTTTICLTEKRVVTFNPQLAKKKIYEIDRQVEKAKSLRASAAKRDEYGDSAKYVTFLPADKKGKTLDGKINVEINQNAIDEDKKLAGYNLIVTSETNLSPAAVYEAYHNLWRIEESFRVMKSQLDARPVYLQKEDTIKGHFLVCYLSVLLLRLLQFKVLKNKFSSEEIMDFVRNFRIVRISDYKSINLSRASNFIDALATILLPCNSYYLSNSDIKTMLNHRF